MLVHDRFRDDVHVGRGVFFQIFCGEGITLLWNFLLMAFLPAHKYCFTRGRPMVVVVVFLSVCRVCRLRWV